MAATALAPFRHHAYRRVWIGAFASNIGTWMETVGVGIYVERVTGQAAWVGLVAAAGFAPNALVGPFGGALADRMPRKTLLIATNTVAAILAALLAVVVGTGHASPPLVAAIVFTSGCVGSIGFPAYMAILPELVPRDDLPGALALSSAQWNLGRIVGPVLAGVVIGIGGYSWAFGVNAVSFAAPVIALLPLAIPSPEPAARSSIFSSIAEGTRFAAREPGIRSMIGYFALNSFLAAPFIALVPSVAALLDGAHVDRATSALVTAQGAGAVAMALALGALVHRLGVRVVLRIVLIALPPALALYACSPGVPAGMLTIFFVGAAYLGALSTFNTIAQLRTPSTLRGRVLSVNMLMLGLLYPVGSIVQGKLADIIGLREVTIAAAVVMAVVLLAGRILSPRFAIALDTPADGEGDGEVPSVGAAPGAAPSDEPTEEGA